MAVGLGKLFGFKFIENFNYPYLCQSISEFWRRWHISLSTWFRDYLYIPLGGNRVSKPRHYFNLVTVFFICGIWHGAGWTFALWGLYQGGFVVLEHTRFGLVLKKMPRPLRHLYALTAVLMGFVVFRTDTLSHAMSFYVAMLGFADATAAQPLERYLTNQAGWAIALGILFSTPVWSWVRRIWGESLRMVAVPLRPVIYVASGILQTIVTLFLFMVSSAWMAGGTYNPFIYFRF
jgi:alginate O-acetyltransferase complex protein AlgI